MLRRGAFLSNGHGSSRHCYTEENQVKRWLLLPDGQVKRQAQEAAARQQSGSVFRSLLGLDQVEVLFAKLYGFRRGVFEPTVHQHDGYRDVHSWQRTQLQLRSLFATWPSVLTATADTVMPGGEPEAHKPSFGF